LARDEVTVINALVIATFALILASGHLPLISIHIPGPTWAAILKGAACAEDHSVACTGP
jgi:hypothetical protein